MADNVHFDMTGVPLKLALSVAFSGSRKATGWTADEEKGFILYWTKSDRATPFPLPLEMEEVLPLVEKWLETATYPPRPSIDGSVSKGWRVYNENWGHVRGEWQAFAAIAPAWMLHGK